MSKTKIYLFVQSILCILLVVVLSIGAVRMARAGEERAKEDPMAWYFSRELVEENLKPVLPLIVITVGSALAGIALGIREEKKEIRARRRANPRRTEPASGRTAEEKSGGVMPDMVMETKKLRGIRSVLIIAGLGMIMAGILNGSAGDVLMKAIRICSECIGLG